MSSLFVIVILVIMALASTQLTANHGNLTGFSSFSGSRLLPEAYANPGDLTISTARTFSSLDGPTAEDDDDTVNGVLTVNGKLTIANGGSITCNDLGASGNSACPISIDVTGNMEMEAGSAIYAENTNNGGNGGDITIQVGGDLTLRGTAGATPGAIISSSKTTGAGDTGVAGDIIIKGTGANSRITLETGSQVLADGMGPAGAIAITAGHSIAIDGLVESYGKMSGTGAKRPPGGGPITIDAGCDLTVSDTGVVSSKGQDPGADLVHLEGGCSVTILGLVESTGPGHAAPNNPTNHCYYQVAGFPSPPQTPVNSADDPQNPRLDKPSSSTACVEVWAGDRLTINSTGVHKGEISADVGFSGGGTGRGWIDLYARSNITIADGEGNDHTIDLPGGGEFESLFAVHANMYLEGHAGFINVKSTTGVVNASGNAIQADNTHAGGDGGEIVVEAKGDVKLETASLFARGDYVATGGYGVGGKIGTLGGNGIGGGNDIAGIRSYNGFVSWQNGVGDVRPTGTASGLTVANRGEIIYQNCTGGNTSATSFLNNGVPATTPTALGQACGGAPTLPDYVVLPDCECGTIVVEKQTIPDGASGSFTFTGTASGTISDNGQIVKANLEAGTYTSTEAVPDGWKLTGITCNDTNSSGDLGTKIATFKLEVGEVVKCAFTDTKLGTIVIEKVSVGGVATFNFSSPDIPDGSPSFTITTASGSTNQTVFSDLPSGIYHVSESGPDAPWGFASLSCDPTQPFLGQDATIDLPAGGSVKCTFTNEKASGQPRIETVLNPSTIVLGAGAVTDKATLSFGLVPTGMITFKVYGAADQECSLEPIATFTVDVNGNGDYTSPLPGFTPPSVGTFQWVASYGGDGNNPSVSSTCGEESLVVTRAAPSIVTVVSPSTITLDGSPDSASDTATLSGGFNPTGTITFNVYGPSESAVCNLGSEVFSSSVTVDHGNGQYTSGSFTPSAAGKYWWVASYSGDGNNDPVSDTCGARYEVLAVEPPSGNGGGRPPVGGGLYSVDKLALLSPYLALLALLGAVGAAFAMRRRRDV